MLTAAPAWLTEDVERIERLLIATAGHSLNPLVSEASTHLIQAGGKRVRPALVLLCSRAGEPGRAATDLAAGAIELVHLATLYHDDVIDQTPTRRGVPTVHSKWGVEIAVLAGDYLFARGCSLGAQAGGEVPGILAGAIAKVCEGQIVETASLGDADRTVDDYLGTIHLKTAALFGAACELGAATADADAATRGALIDYGENLGLAFQIIDDLLDYIGDPDVTGKVPGTDLREGVFTLPVLLAGARDDALVKKLWAGERRIEFVLPRLKATGAIDDALEIADDVAQQASSALASVDNEELRVTLGDLVDSVLAQINTNRAA
jgi:geranylgeranyl pyrophosphate synthase